MNAIKVGIALAASLLASATAQADVSISNKPTQNMSCDAGICTATAQQAVLNVNDLQNRLASGDLIVKTGSVANNIDIDQPLTWANSSRLTLDADHSIGIHQPVVVAGAGAVTITYNDGGSDGNMMFKAKGRIDFFDPNSALVINNQGYLLVGNLAALASGIAANPAGSFALTADYDAEQDRFTTPPIPTPFAGMFEGLGHTISHMQITGDNDGCEGLFATLEAHGVLRDTKLVHVKVTTPIPVHIGSLVGCSSGVIANIAAGGLVRGVGVGEFDDYPGIGGIVGLNYGLVEDSASAVTVTGADYSGVGGIEGLGTSGNEDFNIIRSHATGDVTGGPSAGSAAGGLAGSAYAIGLSYATGNVTGGFAGGLVGFARISMQSFATGHVEGVRVGGLGVDVDSSKDSYSTGDVHCLGQYGGGLLGEFYYDSGYLITTTSYSTGAVAGDNCLLGGSIGYSRQRRGILKTYWDLDTSGIETGCGKGNCGGVKGLRCPAEIQDSERL